MVVPTSKQAEGDWLRVVSTKDSDRVERNLEIQFVNGKDTAVTRFLRACFAFRLRLDEQKPKPLVVAGDGVRTSCS